MIGLGLSAAIQLFVLAALLLSFERLVYVYASRLPADFARHCAKLRIGRDPVSALERLFYFFKLIQFAVFAVWIFALSDGSPHITPDPAALVIGAGLVLFGQFLNLSAFWRLGRVGIFYGSQFGHAVVWCEKFPFSTFRHPQYLGTVLSIWGLLLFFRFPAMDWFLLPVLQTVYYILGSHFEGAEPGSPDEAETAAEAVR
ncbi:MAG: hypothetical protein KDH88_19215 [Chromatiales bacterium]|nr:hypothetical protein [Chromatiales bacterium]